MSRCARPERWRAQVAAVAAGRRGLELDPRLRAVLLDRLPHPQVLALLGPDVTQLCPTQVGLLDQLATLDAGPHGRVYRWIWLRCLWPFDWRLPSAASTRALTPAGIRFGLHGAGSAMEPSALDALPGVRVRVLPLAGVARLALTLEPAALGFAVHPPDRRVP